MSCPYVVDVKGITSMKGCKLSEVNVKWNMENVNKTHYQLCSPLCYDGDYLNCPVYRDRGGETK